MGNETNVDGRDLQTEETDGRGRLSLGTEYANMRVTVAVVEVEATRPEEEEELAAAYRDAAGRSDRLVEGWDETSDGAWAALDG